MTDKIQKIRKGIERLKSLIGNNSFLSDYEKGCNDGREDMCNEIISIIDSLQEEPVNNPINFEQELYKAFGHVKDFTLGMRIAKRFYDMGKNSQEPVSEELEEEIIRYIGYPQEVDEDISTTMIRKAARHFANWQKTKDESTTEDLGEYINELSKQFPEVSFAKLSRIAVRVTKWQKEHLWKPADGDNLPEIDREVIAILDNGKVGFAHRPPEFWDIKNIITGKVTRNYPKTYDKGGWNIPFVKYWLDVELPKEIEL